MYEQLMDRNRIGHNEASNQLFDLAYVISHELRHDPMDHWDRVLRQVAVGCLGYALARVHCNLVDDPLAEARRQQNANAAMWAASQA